MPRSEDFEAGEPRKRRRPADERDEDDDVPRSRRRIAAEDDDEDEDDELPARKSRRRPRKPERSGQIMAVGVTAIVLGSLGLICGVCGGFSGVLLTAVTPMAQKNLVKMAPNDPNAAKAARDLAQAQPVFWLAIAEGVTNVFLGAGLLVGGIGVLRRWNWARYLTLGIAALAILAHIADFAAVLAMGAMTAPAGVGSGFRFLILCAFAGAAFFALLNPKNAREFA